MKIKKIIKKLLIIEESLKNILGWDDYTKTRLIFELGAIYTQIHNIRVYILFKPKYGLDEYRRKLEREELYIEYISNLDKIKKRQIIEYFSELSEKIKHLRVNLERLL
jgi:hypothetical protein